MKLRMVNTVKTECQNMMNEWQYQVKVDMDFLAAEKMEEDALQAMEAAEKIVPEKFCPDLLKMVDQIDPEWLMEQARSIIGGNIGSDRFRSNIVRRVIFDEAVQNLFLQGYYADEAKNMLEELMPEVEL